MRTITHVHKDSDLETDTMIRLDNLNSMISILECGFCENGDSAPTAESIRQYLFHLGQEVDLIRQNLDQITFQEVLPGERFPETKAKEEQVMPGRQNEKRQ